MSLSTRCTGIGNLKRATLAALLLVLGTGLVSANPGDLDGSFQSPLFNTLVSIIAPEADGRVLYAIAEDNIHYSLGRLNSDGSPSATINIGDGAQAISPPIDVGTIHIPGSTNAGSILALKPLPNGQILLGGAFSHFNGLGRKLLVRLNPDGSADPSFNQSNGFQGDNVSSILVTDSGKIYAAGKFTKYGTSSRNIGLVRLNSDGSLDGTFVDGTISFGANVTGITLQSDGKPVIDAAYANASFQATVQVYRLGADGGLDSGFAQGAGSAFSAGALKHASLQNGQTLVTGTAATYNGVTVNPALFRLNADGTVDGSFPGVSLGLIASMNGLIGRFLPKGDGQHYVSGAFDSVNGQTRHGLALLKADGTLDTVFAPAVYVSVIPSALALQTDGKILAGSSVVVGTTPKYNIVRLMGAGAAPPPAPRIGGFSFLPRGRFQMSIPGSTPSVVVQRSSDLATWQPISTNDVVSGLITFFDGLPSQSGAKFYRLIAIP